MDFDVSRVQFGFVGAGKIAQAIVKGILRGGEIKASQISVSAPSNNNLPKFIELGCRTRNDNKFFEKSEAQLKVVFICIKPQVFNKLVKEQGQLIDTSTWTQTTIVVSVLAGVTLESVTKSFSQSPSCATLKFVRITLNTASAIGYGVCVFCHNYVDDSGQFINTFLLKVLKPLGYCQAVPEGQMNALVALAGSGTGFMYSVIQALTDGGVKMGIPRDSALAIASHTVMGAAKMVIESKQHPMVLRDDVTSPGGTTIYGLHAYEEAKVSSGIISAVEAATLRGQQLA